LSTAVRANVTLDATVVVSFPGIIRTGGMLCGTPLVGKTVIRIVTLELSSPSETVSVILCCPTSEEIGVQLKFPIRLPKSRVVRKLAPPGQFRHDKVRFW